MNKKDFLKEEGVYEYNNKIWIHLSPIPNWYYLLQTLEFTCPFCETKHADFLIEKQIDDKLEWIYKEGITHQHRCIVFTCKCGQEFGFENYDESMADYKII